MRLDIHIHLHGEACDHGNINEILLKAILEINKALEKIFDVSSQTNKNAKTIMATQAQAAQALKTLKDQLVKANGEIQAKIQALLDAAANSDTVSDELQAAIDELTPAAQALDDIVPDATGGGDTGGGDTGGDTGTDEEPV